LTVFGDFTKTDCYRGPCYDYEACVSDKCQVHAACAINEIIQFWAQKYRAVVAYVQPIITPAQELARVAIRALPALGAIQILSEAIAPPAAAGVGIGCPTGWYWTVGLTGARCVPPGSGAFPATQEQVIAVIGQAVWDGLVAAGQQGETL
jgi:hypothetical protein